VQDRLARERGLGRPPGGGPGGGRVAEGECVQQIGAVARADEMAEARDRRLLRRVSSRRRLRESEMVADEPLERRDARLVHPDAAGQPGPSPRPPPPTVPPPP